MIPNILIYGIWHLQLSYGNINWFSDIIYIVALVALVSAVSYALYRFIRAEIRSSLQRELAREKKEEGINTSR